MNNELETFGNWTIDRRLKQFRRCETGWDSGGKIDFVDFDTDAGEMIFELKFLMDEMSELEEQLFDKEISADYFNEKSREIVRKIMKTRKLVESLVKERNK